MTIRLAAVVLSTGLLTAIAGVDAAQTTRINLHVIGFGVDASTEQQLRLIASAGNGRYYPAANQAELSAALGQAAGVPAGGGAATQSAEKEDNNGIGSANPIAANGAVSGSIDKLGDHDWYRFQVDRQGLLELTLKGPAEIDPALRLLDPDMRDQTGWRAASAPGAELQATLDLGGSGTFYLELADGSDNAFSKTPYTMQLKFLPGDDFEPDNSYGQAKPINLGQDLKASIDPLRDHDWYAFQVDRQGTLQFLITDPPDNLDVAFRLLNPDAGDMTGWRPARREGGDNDASLALPTPGKYVLELADGNDNQASGATYTLRTKFEPGDDFEPNNSLGMATAITLGQDVKASINPQRDHDWYVFDVASPGKLDLLITDSPDNLDIAFRLLGPDVNDLTGWRGARRMGGDNDAVIEVKVPGTYRLDIADGNDDASAAAPYTLKLKLTP